MVNHGLARAGAEQSHQCDSSSTPRRAPMVFFHSGIASWCITEPLHLAVILLLLRRLPLRPLFLCSGISELHYTSLRRRCRSRIRVVFGAAGFLLVAS